MLPTLVPFYRTNVGSRSFGRGPTGAANEWYERLMRVFGDHLPMATARARHGSRHLTLISACSSFVCLAHQDIAMRAALLKRRVSDRSLVFLVS